LLTSCSSAGKKADPNSQPTTSENSFANEINSTESSEPVYTDCYQSEKIEMLDNTATQYIMLSGDSIIISTISYTNGEIVFYKTDKSFSKYEPFEWEHTEEEENADYSSSAPYFKADGSFNTIVQLQDHNGVKFPKEHDENFDYGSYFEPNTYTTSEMFCTYDSNGKVLTKATFEYPESFFDSEGFPILADIIADNDSVLISTYQNGIYRLDSTGTFTEIKENDDNDNMFNAPQFVCDNNGKILCLINSEDEENTQCNVFEIDGNTISSEPVCTFNYNSIAGEATNGFGKYRLFIPTVDALLGLTDDGTLESVINWFDSDSDIMNAVTAIGENEFIGINYNYYMRFTPRDMREFANVKTITIASPVIDDYMVQNYQNTINDFNRSQSNYRIKTVTITDEVDYKNALNMLILTGEAPDIIYGMDYDNYVNYRKKGLFTDLYSLIDADETLSRDDFMPNVMPLLESPDGKLYGVCDNFYVNTLFTKSSLWNKENWTLDEMLDLYDTVPSSYTHIYDDMCKADMLKIMLNCMTDMVDYENGTCNFNNPDFIKILEFCNRHVTKEPIPDKVTESEAFSNYYGEKYQRFGNDEIIFKSDNVFQYNYVKYMNCGGNDITFAGYPSTDGNGGIIIPNNLMCISEECEDKQGAWEFLKYVMQNTTGLSIISENFERVMDKELSNSWTASGHEIPAFDKETRDKVADYIKSCHKFGTSFGDYYIMPFNSDIFSIIEEETDIYFNGEQTVETCVEHIQDRASVLVSERY
ncbi:MAG: extracellular solute-binding protein, partial [Ruminococcus sp.]|nr:extracellular solute-binding protein [Ruminococcus sp.]